MIVDPVLLASRIEEMYREGWWRDENLLDYFDAACKTRLDDVEIVDFRT